MRVGLGVACMCVCRDVSNHVFVHSFVFVSHSISRSHFQISTNCPEAHTGWDPDEYPFVVQGCASTNAVSAQNFIREPFSANQTIWDACRVIPLRTEPCPLNLWFLTEQATPFCSHYAFSCMKYFEPSCICYIKYEKVMLCLKCQRLADTVLRVYVKPV